MAPIGTGTGGVAVIPGNGGSTTTTPGAGGTSAVSGSGGVQMVGAGGTSTIATGGTGAGGTEPAAGGASSAGGAVSMGGAGGTMSMGGMAGAMSTGGMGGAPAMMPACLKNPGQVVFIGDSYINYIVAHPELSVLIAQDAVKDSALMTGQAYRDYAVAGSTMAAASLNMIPPQWNTAVAASPDIKTVIMDGGGNDVLINNPQCKAAGSQNNDACKMVVDNTVKAVGDLIGNYTKAGVGDLIYFFYPHAPTGGADISDYALGILQNSAKLVTTASFRMYVVDLVPLFNNHPEYFYLDGIHANAQGEQIIADAVYQVMKDHCIAQPASKGCCMP
jgi:lysophospholipase L1-like esterase